MLKGYEGAILSDGFSGYNRFKEKPKITVGNCWSHFRREFYDIRENYPSQTTEILDIIDGLFAIEHRAKTWDELKIHGRSKLPPHDWGTRTNGSGLSESTGSNLHLRTTTLLRLDSKHRCSGFLYRLTNRWSTFRLRSHHFFRGPQLEWATETIQYFAHTCQQDSLVSGILI